MNTTSFNADDFTQRAVAWATHDKNIKSPHGQQLLNELLSLSITDLNQLDPFKRWDHEEAFITVLSQLLIPLFQSGMLYQLKSSKPNSSISFINYSFFYWLNKDLQFAHMVAQESSFWVHLFNQNSASQSTSPGLFYINHLCVKSKLHLSQDKPGPILEQTQQSFSLLCFLFDTAFKTNTFDALLETPEGSRLLAHSVACQPDCHIQALIDLGFNLSHLDALESSAFFEQMLRPSLERQIFNDTLGFHHEELIYKLSHEQKECLAQINEADIFRKSNLWDTALNLGLPALDCSFKIEARMAQSPAALPLLFKEARRGGGLTEQFIHFWLQASAKNKYPTAPYNTLSSPISYAFSHGLKAIDIQDQHFEPLRYAYTAPFINDLLIELAHQGVKLSANDNGFSLHFLELQTNDHGLLALAQMKANLAWQNSVGESIPMHLISIDRIDTMPLLARFLRVSEQHDPAQSDHILQLRATNGSHLIHYAAQAMNVSGLHLALQYHSDIMAQDTDGNTIGHWAARHYTSEKSSKMSSLIMWLLKHDFDFTAKNNQHISAIDALFQSGVEKSLLNLLPQT